MKRGRKIQRLFFPGDNWMFLRIYVGKVSGERILVQKIYPFLKKLINKGFVSDWFFIRYSDPNFHIRIRLRVIMQERWMEILSSFNRLLYPFYEDKSIYRVEIGTYEREIERYGVKNMECSELIFYRDSDCVCRIIHEINEDDNLRWMIALKMIDGFLDVTGCDIILKCHYLSLLNVAYKKEFGYDKYNSKQLNELYRNHKKIIEQVLDENHGNILPSKVLSIIEERNRGLVDILKECDKKTLNVLSYIHMTMNRLFVSDNRTYELLIYNFLYRYYNSVKARTLINK